jgi:hypothetical protein
MMRMMRMRMMMMDGKRNPLELFFFSMSFGGDANAYTDFR